MSLRKHVLSRVAAMGNTVNCIMKKSSSDYEHALLLRDILLPDDKNGGV